MMAVDQNEPAGAGTAELDLLIHQAAGIDAEQAATAPAAVAAAAEEAAAVDMVQQNGQAIYTGLEIAVPLIAQIFPSVGAIYTDEVKARVAGALAPVCAKYGWELKGLGGAYKEEIGACIVLIPLGMATFKGVQEDMARTNAKARQIGQDKQVTPAAPAGSPDFREPAAPVVLG